MDDIDNNLDFLLLCLHLEMIDAQERTVITNKIHNGDDIDSILKDFLKTLLSKITAEDI